MAFTGFVGQPVYRVYKFVWTGLDWIFPPICGGCGRTGKRWCPECQENTQLIESPICQICGQSTGNSKICIRCRTVMPKYKKMRSWAYYEGSVRNAIIRLKYRGDMSMADILSRPLIDNLEREKWDIELVVPVPMGLSRKAERGYNQAALLALPIALSLGLEYSPRALVKIKDVPTQVGLSLENRYENVAGAFKGHDKHVTGKGVLIVDDVITSGATMNACTRALLQAGAERVYGMTLARTDVHFR